MAVAQKKRMKLITATASRIHLRTLLTRSSRAGSSPSDAAGMRILPGQGIFHDPIDAATFFDWNFAVTLLRRALLASTSTFGRPALATLVRKRSQVFA